MLEKEALADSERALCSDLFAQSWSWWESQTSVPGFGGQGGHTAVMGIGGGRVDNLCPELYATCLIFILFMD